MLHTNIGGIPPTLNTYGYSPRGLKGRRDKALAKNVYDPRHYDGNLAAIFPPHEVYPFKEDVPCVCLAKLRDGIRQNPHVEEVYGVGFDIDGGMTLGEGRTLAQKFGAEALLYSSYNHEANRTIITEDRLHKDVSEGRAPSDLLTDFAILKEAAETGKLTPRLRRELTAPFFDYVRSKGILCDCDLYLHKREAGWHPPVNGKFEKQIEYGIFAQHENIQSRQKFRIVFLFVSPFIGTPREYRYAVDSLAEAIGIRHVIDDKAKNLAQALYVPSCARGNESRVVYQVLNEGGKRVELRDYVREVEEAEDVEETYDPLPDDKLADAFRIAIRRLKCITDNREFALEFYYTFKTSFRIMRFMRTTVGERYSYDYSGDETSLKVVCPHGAAHSGEPSGFVRDAEHTQSGRGWHWGCHHNHSGLPPDDRPTSTIDYLEEALDQGWFTRADMLSKDVNHNFNKERLAYDLAQFYDSEDE